MNTPNDRAAMLEQAAVESGNLALKSLLLLNGAACIAILGFLSSVASKEPSPPVISLIAAFVGALGLFAWGAGLAVLASGLAYFTNSFYAAAAMPPGDQKLWKRGRLANWIAIIVSLSSFGFFIWGIMSVQSTAAGPPMPVQTADVRA